MIAVAVFCIISPTGDGELQRRNDAVVVLDRSRI